MLADDAFFPYLHLVGILLDCYQYSSFRLSQELFESWAIHFFLFLEER